MNTRFIKFDNHKVKSSLVKSERSIERASETVIEWAVERHPLSIVSMLTNVNRGSTGSPMHVSTNQNSVSSNKTFNGVLRVLGKRLAKHQSVHAASDVDMLLPQFYAPLSDNRLQVVNAGCSIAVVGQPMEQSFGVRVATHDPAFT